MRSVAGGGRPSGSTQTDADVDLPLGEGSGPADAAAHPPSKRSRLGRTTWSAWWPVLLLTALVLAIWARPVLTDFGSARLSNPGDSVSFEFYLRWNVHAVLQGHDPFFTPNMYAPRGLDLGNAISIPAVSLLLAPVTLLFGATAAFNTGVLLAILLTAVSTYLLALELTGNKVGSFVAGALMIVNPYFVGHSLSHFNLMWIFGLPLIAFLFARHLHGRLGWPWLVLGTALVVGFTFGASTELAVTETVFGALALCIALALAPGATRIALLRTTGWLTVGGAVGGVLALPVVLASLRSGIPAQPANPPVLYSSDVLNVVAPTRMFLLGGDTSGPWTNDWLSNDAERTAYLPITLLVLAVVLFAVRRNRFTAGLGIFGLVSLVFSFGPALTVDGTPHGSLPWAVALHLPGLDHALPGRFSTFVFLALCLLIAAAWPRSTKGAVAVGATAAASAALMLPDFGYATIPVQTVDRSFISSGDYKQVIDRNQIVLVLPGGQAGAGIQWMTDSDFWFRLPTGNGGGAIAPTDLNTDVGRAIFEQDTAFDYDHGLRRWARNRGVSRVVVPQAETYWTQVATSVFGAPHETVDDIDIWIVKPKRHPRHPDAAATTQLVR